MATLSQRGNEKQNIVAELEGALLVSRSQFPYFMVIALEAGGPVRTLLLLLLVPLMALLDLLRLNEVSLRLMIFVSTSGLGVSDLKAAAKAALPRFYLEDLRPSAYEIFSRCKGKRCVVTSSPRIMVEPFLREYLDVDFIVGTELRTVGGRCLGFAAPAAAGIVGGGTRMVGVLDALVEDAGLVTVGLSGGGGIVDKFMSLCKEQHFFTSKDGASTLPRRCYPKPLIFHDGRLAARPTPLTFFIVLLWLPFGIVLAVLRIFLGLGLPYKLSLLASAVTGLRIRAQFPTTQSTTTTRRPTSLGRAHSKGTLFACNHRTLLDPVIISTALQQKVTAVTYSLSRISEFISPIPTVRLSRDRSKDGAMMRSLLDHGDLVVCPEGTTCREPYLLRFSPLFAEIADNIVPIAVMNEGSMFYGTTVRGYKGLDALFFLMNPSPLYQLNFLERITLGSKPGSSYDVANDIQQSIAGTIGFKCTNLTRRDKYRMLAGHDGLETRN